MDERLYTLYIFQEENRKENEDPGWKIVAENFAGASGERSGVNPTAGESNSSLSLRPSHRRPARDLSHNPILSAEGKRLIESGSGELHATGTARTKMSGGIFEGSICASSTCCNPINDLRRGRIPSEPGKTRHRGDGGSTYRREVSLSLIVRSGDKRIIGGVKNSASNRTIKSRRPKRQKLKTRTSEAARTSARCTSPSACLCAARISHPEKAIAERIKAVSAR